MTGRRLTIIATGPSGPPEELDPLDKIDVPAATRLGVLVANSPTKENFIAVAEATIGLLLMLLKRVKRGESRLRSGEWARREDRGDFLFGKTVGIVGLGRIGTHVARRLAGWDVRLLATDPYVPASAPLPWG